MAQVIGRPGGHAATLMVSRLRSAVVFAVLAAAVAVPLRFLFPFASDLDRVAALCAVVAFASAAYRSRQQYVAFLKARAGVRTERRVARRLEALPAALVAHGMLLGDRQGDVDHLVLGPWAAVIESKTGRGPVSYRKGTLRVGARRLPRDPVRQAAAQRDLAARRFGVTFDAVVCIVDATSAPQQFNGVWVCSLADLYDVVAALPARLSHGDVARIAANLSA